MCTGKLYLISIFRYKKSTRIQSKTSWITINRLLFNSVVTFVLKKHKFVAITSINSVLAAIALKFYVTRGYLLVEEQWNETEICTMPSNHIIVVTNNVINLCIEWAYFSQYSLNRFYYWIWTINIAKMKG